MYICSVCMYTLLDVYMNVKKMLISVTGIYKVCTDS